MSRLRDQAGLSPPSAPGQWDWSRGVAHWSESRPSSSDHVTGGFLHPMSPTVSNTCSFRQPDMIGTWTTRHWPDWPT